MTTQPFEADTGRVLNIVINSLYSEKEIFLRELISNSSDACEKLRYVSQTNSSLNETSQFEIRIHLNEKNKTITIKDNGIGMTPIEQKKIFDKFFRASSGDIHDVKGHGLGLSYVKKIVDLHKGEIKLKSKKNFGTDFTVRIPITNII